MYRSITAAVARVCSSALSLVSQTMSPNEASKLSLSKDTALGPTEKWHASSKACVVPIPDMKDVKEQASARWCELSDVENFRCKPFKRQSTVDSSYCMALLVSTLSCFVSPFTCRIDWTALTCMEAKLTSKTEALSWCGGTKRKDCT